jgi:hypothetical protein
MSAAWQVSTERRLGWVTFGAAMLVAAFWLIYVVEGVSYGSAHDLVGAYEAAFPVADAAFGGSLIAASVSLLRHRPAGPFFLVMAASMSVYLGILDVTFYASQGLYATLGVAAVVELTVNACCIGGGAIGLWHGARLWRTR